MRLNYYIVKESKFYEELDLEMDCYGIEIEKVEDDGEKYERSEIKDISCVEEKVLRLAELLKRNQVFPVHLKEIVEDFI